MGIKIKIAVQIGSYLFDVVHDGEKFQRICLVGSQVNLLPVLNEDTLFLIREKLTN